MSGEDSCIIWGIVIFAIIFLLFKSFNGFWNTGYDSSKKSKSLMSKIRNTGSDGGVCICNRKLGRCLCNANKNFTMEMMERMKSRKENMQNRRSADSKYCGPPCNTPIVQTPECPGDFGCAPNVVADNGNYSGETIQEMSLEPEVMKSQKDYINGLGFAGLPTGSSHETILSPEGRSYGTANWVGLTQRKWCKARTLAPPAPEARVVPTETEEEWCNITMDALV